MSLKSFFVAGMLTLGSLSSQAQQKVAYTAEADLFYLFLTQIEQGTLPSVDFVWLSGPDNLPYDCKPYDFTLPSGKVSLYYCPKYQGWVIIEYPYDIKEKQKNILRTELYTQFQSNNASFMD